MKLLNLQHRLESLQGKQALTAVLIGFESPERKINNNYNDHRLYYDIVILLYMCMGSENKDPYQLR